ncbi:MAG: DUF58 domain-containing protein [Thermoanaerobaculia bacterium]|nr:DUF58 domain-containing protein [Thermoanaerobaculia bacterium]
MSSRGRSRRSEKRRRWPVPERIRPTKVGFWYILCTLLVGVAATNTGNNALYIVLAVMLSLLILSGVVSRFNLKRLAFTISEEREVFAKRPFHLEVGVHNRSRWLPRWLLVLSLADDGQPLLIPYLPRAGTGRGFMEMLVPRRGRHRFSWIHVGSIFPVGFFHKGLRYAVDVEVLVYPEIFPASAQAPVQSGNRGEGLARKSGWGHDLHSLRSFQPGDDPRRIHWKQTARTGKMILTQREAEEGNRLSILFDNAVGELLDPAIAARFESLISEAATTALDYLDQGFEVELVTRDSWLPFGGGRQQRSAILQTLALLEAGPLRVEPMVSHGASLQLRLGLDRREEVA